MTLPLLPLLLTACWTPRETGPNSMIGTLHDAGGAPLVGVAVETVEARSITDAEGRFGVHYKDPSRYVHLTHEGIWFKRSYQTADDGTVVRLELPARETRAFDCDANEACQATLTWQLSETLEAVVRTTCDPDEPPKSLTVPAGLAPTSVVCRVGPTGADAPLHVWPTATGARLSPPPVTLEVDVDFDASDESLIPTSCDVTVDGVSAQRVGPRRYAAEVFGRVTVRALCDGIPAEPKTVVARESARVHLAWTPETPTLDLLPHVPWASSVALVRTYGNDALWRLDVQAGNDGLVHLPPLTPGRYLLAIGPVWEGFNGLRLDEQQVPDVVQLVKLPYTTPEGQPYVVAALDLREAPGPGPLAVELTEQAPPP